MRSGSFVNLTEAPTAAFMDSSPSAGAAMRLVVTSPSRTSNDRSRPAMSSFRIPTPTFGAGLIEAIDDSTILANKSANASAKSALGISGRENRTGNDGSITRFGWKAQNKSLMIFSGEAYNVEQGVTNDLFANERDTTPGCQFNATPEDHIDVNSR